MSPKESESKEYEHVLSAALGPVVESYYSLRINAASNSRARAQAVLSVLSLLLGALVGAFSVVVELSLFTQIFGFLAVLLWLLASALYVWSTSPPDPEGIGDKYVVTREELISNVINRAKEESREAKGRQRKADVAALVALVFTVIALAVALFLDPKILESRVTLVLDSEALGAIAGVCGEGVNKVSGFANPGDVQGDFIRLRLTDGECGESDSILQIPVGSVVVMRWEDV